MTKSREQTADFAKGSVYKIEDLKRNFIFEASKASIT